MCALNRLDSSSFSSAFATYVAVTCLITVSAVHAGAEDTIAIMTVEDIAGSYTIPYIQSDRTLKVNVDFSNSPATSAKLTLRGPKVELVKEVTRLSPQVVFSNIPTGELTLVVVWLKPGGGGSGENVYKRIGVGSVVAAIGDSLTEGYHGHGFKRQNLNLKHSDFPLEAVSKDGRNFPQFSPTTAYHKPTVNCFQSWMTELNDKLSKAWQMPVFIANEGWGGYTSASYLAMMRDNKGGWSDRMNFLRPNVWLIHLGVNDERHKVSAADFAKNMRAIIKILLDKYNALPSRIYIAYPSYDYAPGAEPVLRSYITEIDKIISELKLRKGPDFFSTFAKDKKRWYGTDPVHPGIEGISLMAELWADILYKQEID